MNQKSLQRIIGVGLVALFLVGCSTPAATPESIGEVITPAGKFDIVEVEISDRFPPNCTSSTPGCQQAKSGYRVLVI
jgi:PBP1b-binding outer membrane lipoprotein LpoB